MSDRKEFNSVALLYHANLNHFSLSPSGRESLARQYISDMIEHVKIPIAVSLPAEDLLYLYLQYPETYVDLTSNPYITFLLSTYAHSVAAHDFGVYLEQAELGKSIFDSLLPEKKLLPVGYPSEVDVPKPNDQQLLNSIWNSIVLGDTRVLPRQEVDHFYWNIDNGLQFPVILSRRENLYRSVFHKYFRSEASSRDVVQALERDATLWSNTIGYLARIDFEAPLFNEVNFSDGSSTGPRIDLWQRLNEEYAKNAGLFITMRDLLQKMREKELDPINISHDPIEDSKWQFVKYSAHIEELGHNGFVHELERYAWLSTHHSDYFCTEKDDWVFKTSDGGVITIVKKQIYREPELIAKLDLLQGKPYSGDDKAVGDYISKITTVYSYLAERKDEFTS